MNRLLLKAAFWAAVVLVGTLSLVPATELPAQVFNIWDKAQHAGGFLLLALLGGLAYQKPRGRVLFGLLVYGALIEVAQSATGWRNGDLFDLVADAVGVWLGALLLAMPLPWSQRSRPQ
ncbi:VanZ family protein [Hydrogenophaga pseudoflava]|uniref:VanZ like family protein n=1 Tax=Hydrogenophaga pseudoflava TaxID=47421 RepID=A0A4P6WYU2_HYDPS|nr:VanZ family protein [Hydrogenophaga pseudoflava]QBM28830.1 VanZ like family protein [Hydrogenophaga pseudoflava]